MPKPHKEACNIIGKSPIITFLALYQFRNGTPNQPLDVLDLLDVLD